MDTRFKNTKDNQIPDKACPINCLLILKHDSLFSLSCSANQRANVISCVTVHDSQDSDSSTCSPLSPKRLPNFAESSGQGSKSLAVVMPSLKTQPWEGLTNGTSLHSNPDNTNFCCLCSHGVFCLFVFQSKAAQHPQNLRRLQLCIPLAQDCPAVSGIREQ